MLSIVVAGFIAAVFAPILFKYAAKPSAIILALVPAAIFVHLLSFLNAIIGGQEFSFSYAWVPQLTLDLHFYLDGLSLFFALLISAFGALIILYSGTYLKGHHHRARFYVYLLAFMGSMLGLVLAGNLITLFLFWELTSLSSYMLIGFNHENERSRESALQAMIVTFAGGMFLLAGFILLGLTGNSYNIPELLQSGDLLREHPLYLPIIILILIGAGTKSAQFPFHFWLPNAMAAPTPVSAYLHSATMVKAGIYLIARFTPVLGGTIEWQTIIISAGTITLLLGAVMAFMQKDIKRILAYTTISALGIIILMIGIGTALAIKASIVFLLAHALYKGALFLLAGNLDVNTGSRDINILSGLGRAMPLTAVATIFSALSMAGIIPVFGFIGKELLYEAALSSPFMNMILFVAVFISGTIFVSISFEFGYSIFFGKKKETPEVPREATIGMLAGPVVLASATLFFGIFPSVVQPILGKVSAAILPAASELDLALWHGFNKVLMLSLLTIALGFLLYLFRKRIRHLQIMISKIDDYGPERIYNITLHALQGVAKNFTTFLQNGLLRNYMTTIILVFIAFASFTMLKHGNWSEAFIHRAFTNVRVYEIILMLSIVAGVAIFLFTKFTLAAIIAMGVVGYGVGIIFFMFSAPDVAITQFLIETLTVILFVLILHKLPRFRKFGHSAKQIVYLLTSLAFGALMTLIILFVTYQPLSSKLKAYFIENSDELGKGKNIVNVILVDFRALDTLGEITVLCIAALGIFSLLKLKLDPMDK